jgi:steroid 5-alpha reductase family enzyme
MTFFLTRVSGLPILERAMARRKPGYEAYTQRTSGFIPLPPRPVAANNDSTV